MRNTLIVKVSPKETSNLVSYINAYVVIDMTNEPDVIKNIPRKVLVETFKRDTKYKVSQFKHLSQLKPQKEDIVVRCNLSKAGDIIRDIYLCGLAKIWEKTEKTKKVSLLLSKRLELFMDNVRYDRTFFHVNEKSIGFYDGMEFNFPKFISKLNSNKLGLYVSRCNPVTAPFENSFYVDKEFTSMEKFEGKDYNIYSLYYTITDSKLTTKFVEL